MDENADTEKEKEDPKELKQTIKGISGEIRFGGKFGEPEVDITAYITSVTQDRDAAKISGTARRLKDMQALKTILGDKSRELENLEDMFNHNIAMCFDIYQERIVRRHYEPQLTFLRDKIARLESSIGVIQDTLDEAPEIAGMRDGIAMRLLNW